MKTHSRVERDTRRTFAVLVAVSVVLHLVLTPFAGWIALFDQWLRPPPIEEAPEQLRQIPIELFSPPQDEATPPTEGLPDEDPVEMIDELIVAPGSPKAPAEPAKESEPESPKPEPTKEQTKDPPKPAAADAGSGRDPGDAGARPVAKRGADGDRSERNAGSSIEDPVALAGKGAKLAEKQTHVGLILYMDRIRAHPVGRRIGNLLPRLPQWRDFFGEGKVSPVRDFDRMFLLGPSFVDSAGLVMAIAYNTSPDVMRASVDALVKNHGKWLTDAPVPAALTFADRSERLVFFPAPQLVMVVPPHLKEQAFRDKFTGIPAAKGPEAMVAFVSEPRKALRRFGVDVPQSVRSAKLRITPLSDGRVRLELDAEDESEESARVTATRVSQGINATIDLVSGVSDLLGRFGFGGVAAGASLPRVRLRAEGKWVRGQQVLTESQVSFILDRVERQLLRPARIQPTPSSKPNSPRPQPTSQSSRPALGGRPTNGSK